MCLVSSNILNWESPEKATEKGLGDAEVLPPSIHPDTEIGLCWCDVCSFLIFQTIKAQVQNDYHGLPGIDEFPGTQNLHDKTRRVPGQVGWVGHCGQSLWSQIQSLLCLESKQLCYGALLNLVKNDNVWLHKSKSIPVERENRLQNKKINVSFMRARVMISTFLSHTAMHGTQ